jgi:ubiquinone/menaquinone biosynthesis C-methylase UbiE
MKEQIKEQIKELYDSNALRAKSRAKDVRDLHENISPVMKYFRGRKVQTALTLGKFKYGSKLLEVGCNTGQYTTLFGALGYQMSGVDLSDNAIELAKENSKSLNLNIDYFQADVEKLSMLEENSFDGIVSFSALRYLSDLKIAFKEIHRVTKKGGVVVLDFPNKHCPWFNILKNRFGVGNHINDHFYTIKVLSTLFEEAGFSGFEARKILFTHYTFPPAFLPIYEAIDFTLERTAFIKEAAAIIVCKGIK